MGTKYKSGDRFVLKIEKVVTSENTTLYKTNCNDYLLLPGDLDELPKIIDGFEETSYIAGAQDAWEVAGLIGKLTVDELEEIFGHIGIHKIYNMPYGEVKDKIESWEESKRKIKRGDEVKNKSNNIGIVLATYGYNTCLVLWKDNSINTSNIIELVKTGNNFADELNDVVNILGK